MGWWRPPVVWFLAISCHLPRASVCFRHTELPTVPQMGRPVRATLSPYFCSAVNPFPTCLIALSCVPLHKCHFLPEAFPVTLYHLATRLGQGLPGLSSLVHAVTHCHCVSVPHQCEHSRAGFIVVHVMVPGACSVPNRERTRARSKWPPLLKTCSQGG